MDLYFIPFHKSTYEERIIELFKNWLVTHPKNYLGETYAYSTAKDYANSLKRLSKEFLDAKVITKPLERFVYSELDKIIFDLINDPICINLDSKGHEKYRNALKRFLEFLIEKHIFLRLIPSFWYTRVPNKDYSHVDKNSNDIFISDLAERAREVLEGYKDKDLEDFLLLLMIIILLYKDKINEKSIKEILRYPIFNNNKLYDNKLLNDIMAIIDYLLSLTINSEDVKISLEELAMMLLMKYHIDVVKLIKNNMNNILGLLEELLKHYGLNSDIFNMSFEELTKVINEFSELNKVDDKWYNLMIAILKLYRLYLVFYNFHQNISQD